MCAFVRDCVCVYVCLYAVRVSFCVCECMGVWSVYVSMFVYVCVCVYREGPSMADHAVPAHRYLCVFVCEVVVVYLYLCGHQCV